MGDKVSSTTPIVVSYPSDVVQLTDIYVNPLVKYATEYSVDVDPQNGTVTLSFTNLPAALPIGKTAFELWFAAPEDSITNKFYMANGAFQADTEGTGLREHIYLLGDHGRSGNLNDMMMWYNFIIPSGGTSIPLDVNRDMVVNLDDQNIAQSYLNGEIISLFY